jgi:hypothetical protein
MAKHKGRGIATIEYPTGMNQNGDPSQAWVKLKPDGRVDVFAGTVDIGQGSRTVHTQIVADTLGVPYDWVTMDNTNTDSSPVCTGSLRRRLMQGGERRRHRIEERQRNRGPERAQHGAARQRPLGDHHEAVLPIWNGVLDTIPRTIDDQRYPDAAASRTMRRIAG